MNNLLSKVKNNILVKTEVLQLTYALIVIILVPTAFALNTIYLLNSFERDMDYELNNKALLVATTISKEMETNLNDNVFLQSRLTNIVNSIPEVKAVELFRFNQDEMKSITSTSQTTKTVSDPVLNQIAWARDEAASKQIMARVGSGSNERIWLVALPIHDQANKKAGMINVYLSAAEIDNITQRTMHDSLIILVITLFAILLLLLNHFRFYETSLLFKKLHEVDDLKDEFLSITSHELKAPMVVIKGYACLMLDNKIIKENPELNRYLMAIKTTTERLRILIDDILDVSRIEQNRIVYEYTNADIRNIMQQVIDEFKLTAKEKNLTITYTPGDSPLIINCDTNKMKQIFVNLISNAVKYTLQGGVTVYYEVENDFIKTYVKDTGVGISDEDRGKLFNKFSRIYNEKTKDVQGSGLGLWIIKQMIEKMKGKITVESIKNQGTQFIIVFPRPKNS